MQPRVETLVETDQTTDITQNSRAHSLKFLKPFVEETMNIYGFK